VLSLAVDEHAETAEHAENVVAFGCKLWSFEKSVQRTTLSHHLALLHNMANLPASGKNIYIKIHDTGKSCSYKESEYSLRRDQSAHRCVQYRLQPKQHPYSRICTKMVLVRRRLQRVGHWLHNQVHDLLYLSHSERREQRRQRRREREQEVREQRNQYILELLEAQDDERRRAREIEEENEEVQSVLSYESYEEIEGVVTVIVQIAGSISSQVAGEALRRWADDIYDGPAPGEDIRVFLVVRSPIHHNI